LKWVEIIWKSLTGIMSEEMASGDRFRLRPVNRTSLDKPLMVLACGYLQSARSLHRTNRHGEDRDTS
jgi:hypothetical protein